MSTYELEWYAPSKVEQTDASFYCWGDGMTSLGILKADGRTFHIVANGEMRLNIPVPDVNGEYQDDLYDVVRYTDALLQYAKTDEELRNLTDYWIEQGVDIWVNNNWFEWYEVDDDHDVDSFWEVQDDLEECVASILNLVDMGENPNG